MRARAHARSARRESWNLRASLPAEDATQGLVDVEALDQRGQKGTILFNQRGGHLYFALTVASALPQVEDAALDRLRSDVVGRHHFRASARNHKRW